MWLYTRLTSIIYKKIHRTNIPKLCSFIALSPPLLVVDVTHKHHRLSYSFLWSPFSVTYWHGYGCFSISLYSCHKGVLVHMWLLTWCLHGATRAWSFLIYRLSDVSQIILLQALYFTPVWTGRSLVLPSTVTLLSWMRPVFPGSCVSFFDYVPILSMHIFNEPPKK